LITCIFSIKNQRSGVNWPSRPTTNFTTFLVKLLQRWHTLAVWLSGNGVTHINEVTLRRSRLVLGWVTAGGYTILAYNQPPRPTQPGHPSVGRRNKYRG